MNTTKDGNNLAIATGYYHEMLQKNFEAMVSYLHPNVRFIGPLTELSGKDAVVLAAKNLSQILEDIHIRAKFSSGNQIMLAYDFKFPQPMGNLRAAVLMDFTDQLISRIELFFDGRPLEGKKDAIFSTGEK